MRRGFDPAEKRTALLGSARIRRLLAEPLTSLRATHSLGSWGRSLMNEGIYSIIVGLTSLAQDLIIRANECLESVTASGERPNGYLEHFDEGQNWLSLALARWLLDNEHDARCYQRGLEAWTRYYSGGNLRDKVAISLALPCFLDGGECPKALDIFRQTPNLRPPKPTRPKLEAGLVYIHCAHVAEGEFSQEELVAATRRFLNANVDIWLDGGDATTTARWMKIVYWNGDLSRRPTASAATLRCYDHLPAASAGKDHLK